MKASEPSSNQTESKNTPHKPPFRLAKDDTKPIFQDPILRSDPIETEEAVLRPPPFHFNVPISKSKSKSNTPSS